MNRSIKITRSSYVRGIFMDDPVLRERTYAIVSVSLTWLQLRPPWKIQKTQLQQV